MATQRIPSSVCVAQWDRHAMLSERPTRQAALSCPHYETTNIGVASFVLLVLVIALSVSAEPDTAPGRNEALSAALFAEAPYSRFDPPICTQFDPDPAETWIHDAWMPPKRVTTSLGCEACPGDAYASQMNDIPSLEGDFFFLNTTWAADVPVTGNFTTLVSILPKDRNLKEKVYVPYVDDWFGSPTPRVTSAAAVCRPPLLSSRGRTQTAPTARHIEAMCLSPTPTTCSTSAG